MMRHWQGSICCYSTQCCMDTPTCQHCLSCTFANSCAVAATPPTIPCLLALLPCQIRAVPHAACMYCMPMHHEVEQDLCGGAELSRALVPRAVTLALAMPIAEQLGAPTAIAAAGVSLTGLLGGNFGVVRPWHALGSLSRAACRSCSCSAITPSSGAACWAGVRLPVEAVIVAHLSASLVSLAGHSASSMHPSAASYTDLLARALLDNLTRHCCNPASLLTRC